MHVSKLCGQQLGEEDESQKQTSSSPQQLSMEQQWADSCLGCKRDDLWDRIEGKGITTEISDIDLDGSPLPPINMPRDVEVRHRSTKDRGSSSQKCGNMDKASIASICLASFVHQSS